MMRLKHLINCCALLVLAALAAACTTLGSSPLTTTVPTSKVIIVTETSPPFKFKPLEFTQLGNAKVGINACTQGQDIGVTIRVRINKDPTGSDQGEWVAPEEGNQELGVPCFTPNDRPIWNTANWPVGTYLVKAEAKIGNEWDDPISTTGTYEVKSGVNGHQ